MARPTIPLVLAASALLGGCVVAPSDRSPPKRGTRSWETPPPPRDEAFEWRLGGVVITFPALAPMPPPGGVERGESFAGAGIDLLGIGVSTRERARPTPPPPPPPPSEDAPARAWRDLRDDLERSLERARRTAERAPDGAP